MSNGQWNVSAPASVGGGGGGSVTQSNDADNSASAGNSNDTSQDASQGQASSGDDGDGDDGDGSGQSQSADVSNDTDQSADASVDSEQSNTNAGASVGGDGGGDVSQSNSADNSAEAGNKNTTEQVVEQGQASSGDDGAGQTQDATASNGSAQDADATVDSGQDNTNAPASVGGEGSGAVDQSNDATNDASAGNSNDTVQDVVQGQAASGEGSGDQWQSADVSNDTSQSADAWVDNGQYNTNAPASVDGGMSGDVSQSNTADNSAEAGNENITDQVVDQAQASSGSYGNEGQYQEAYVANDTAQDADATVDNGQWNDNTPASVGGEGSGMVMQANDAVNSAAAGNSNDTIQDVVQGQAASSVSLLGEAATGSQEQVADVWNTTSQSADAWVANGQHNTNAPASVDGGMSGDVSQSNTADNSAEAGNENITDQVVEQGQAASAIGVLYGTSTGGQYQDAIVTNDTAQDADATVENGQWNTNAPASTFGEGSGSVMQSNDAVNSAAAGNSNDTVQDVVQGQAASAIGLLGNANTDAQEQVADVVNTTSQSADAWVANGQWNTNAPASVGGGMSGDVMQSNTADNSAAAGNENITDQVVEQGQASSAIALLGSTLGAAQYQDAIVDNDTAQDADATVENGQWNTNAGASVGGEGSGMVMQSNDATNMAAAGNSNDTIQDVVQGQASSSGGGYEAFYYGPQEQVADVVNSTSQSADAWVGNGQWNTNAPASVFGGASGDVTQSNTADNSAEAGNANITDQVVEQGQADGSDTLSQSQDAIVDNDTAQDADAYVDSGQWNTNAGASVGGEGSGMVMQSNDATNMAAAGNSNDTIQDVVQGQASTGTTGGQEQIADAVNSTSQSADAWVGNGQWNTNAPASVGGGMSGDVSQSNTADNSAEAGNENITDQVVEQGQAGGDASYSSQDAIVDNDTAQDADATVENGQWNTNAPASAFGEGSGSVDQSNDATNMAAAGNSNDTIQDVVQGQAGSGEGSGDQDQVADVVNSTSQSADAWVDSGQHNTNAPASVDGGMSGDVSQSNTADNSAEAGNENITDQVVEQGQAASAIGLLGDASTGGQSQGAYVDNDTAQDADATVDNGQWNDNAGASVGGDGSGMVMQSNDAVNSASAGNSNDTIQDVVQGQAASAIGLLGLAYTGSQVQTADAVNSTSQSADAWVDSGQYNTNAPASVDGGMSGDVTQSNTADNSADAGNENITDQVVEQGQAASAVSLLGDGTTGDQWHDAYVDNDTAQDADATVDNGQWNDNAGASVGGDGSGMVMQSNDAVNSASAGNSNDTIQDVVQGQAAAGAAPGSLGPDVQSGQSADVVNSTSQSADAWVDSGQYNTNAPASVDGGMSGDVSQSNTADNSADAGNENITDQVVDQAQASSGVDGSAIRYQDAIVDNDTSQDADATVESGQWNTNAPASAYGEGSGAVDQSNDATNDASAGNTNDTIQDVVQGQALAGGRGDQTQAADVVNTTSQSADAWVDSGQYNTNAPASVDGGMSGDVSQSNTADNSADAGNENITDQVVDQAQANSGGTAGSDGTGGQSQDAIVDNDTSQDADAYVDNGQWNDNAGASVGGEGSGMVMQSNDAVNSAAAGNSNDTIQDVVQGQAASGGSGEQDQIADAVNSTSQSADAWVGNGQYNTNAPASVDGGMSGDVTQSNTADNSADAGNENVTDQVVDQGQANSGGTGGSGGQSQDAIVDNDTAQDADATVENEQANTNAGASVGGDGSGSVDQSNDATNDASAGNSNDTIQDVVQGQAGTGSGADQDQVADTINETSQSADATIENAQANTNAGASVGGGGSGDVSQSNDATNTAESGNENSTEQVVDQGQASTGTGTPAPSASRGTGQAGSGSNGWLMRAFRQLAGLGNSTSQSANAWIWNGQWNIYAPVSVGSPGANSGAVSQSNDATNTATAGNSNGTTQGVGQGQAGNGTGSSGQAAGLTNGTSQSANATIYNLQANIYAPIWVGSPGAGSGSVTQSNTATNTATAGNSNTTDQAVGQGSAGSGGGTGQSAELDNSTSQSATASIWNAQWNIYAPVAVFSPGAGSGSVTQTNDATNTATAGNANGTTQATGQGAAGGGGSQSGQTYNMTFQSADGTVYNVQANIYAPVTVGSMAMGGGSVNQWNRAVNRATSGNTNSTFQSLFQGLGMSLFRF